MREILVLLLRHHLNSSIKAIFDVVGFLFINDRLPSDKTKPLKKLNIFRNKCIEGMAHVIQVLQKGTENNKELMRRKERVEGCLGHHKFKEHGN